MKISIYYKLQSKEIVAMCQGVQTLDKGFNFLSGKEAKMIYGIFTIEGNEFILTHPTLFTVVEKEDGKLGIELKNEIKNKLKNLM